MTRSTSAVSVIAGGWSFLHMNPMRIPGYVIAVNDSAYYLQGRKVDEVVSMDRLWAEHRWDWLCERKVHAHIRKSAAQNLRFGDGPATTGTPPWLNVFECDNGSVQLAGHDYGPPHFALYPGRLNGTNSGTCALNRAFHIRPLDLYLFGFDMQDGPEGQQHWHPPYPWADRWKTNRKKFTTWAGEFDLIAKQLKSAGIRVCNVSHRSLITQLPTLDYDDFPVWKGAA